jgi:hypothetical protein
VKLAVGCVNAQLRPIHAKKKSAILRMADMIQGKFSERDTDPYTVLVKNEGYNQIQ